MSKSRVFVGKVHSVGEINTSTHPRNQTRMVTLELRWNFGASRALFRADGKLGSQIMNYLTGDKIEITALPTGEKLGDLDIYDITEVRMK